MPVPDDFSPSTQVLHKLLDMRGGCRCFTGRAPCSACESPITDAEFDELLDAFPDELAEPVDYSAATKAMCR